MDLSKERPDWLRLPASSLAEKESDATETEVSDSAFQSKKTASIISINSGCRASYEGIHKDLQSFTNLLLLGMTDVTLREEKNLTIQDLPALQTTVQGKMNNESMVLRTVVIRKRSCVYDLVYISRPDHFSQQEADFEIFVASLKLK